MKKNIDIGFYIFCSTLLFTPISIAVFSGSELMKCDNTKSRLLLLALFSVSSMMSLAVIACLFLLISEIFNDLYKSIISKFKKK